MKKSDHWIKCGKTGSLQVVSANKLDWYYSWHLPECEECKLIKEGTKTIQDYFPNSAIAGYNYKFRKNIV